MADTVKTTKVMRYMLQEFYGMNSSLVTSPDRAKAGTPTAACLAAVGRACWASS